MSDAPVNLEWIGRTLRQVQSEQASLRGMIEPLPARFGALEARFTALEARMSGIEQSVNAIGLTLRELVNLSHPD
jgi:hypothetical protein